MKVEFNDLEFVPRNTEYDERGFLISKTKPSIDGSTFESECTADFDGTHNCKATFYLGIDCEVGCFVQIGDMAIGLGLGFNDLYGLKLFLDDLFAMPNDSEELKLTSDEINSLLEKRDAQFQKLWSERKGETNV